MDKLDAVLEAIGQIGKSIESLSERVDKIEKKENTSPEKQKEELEKYFEERRTSVYKPKVFKVIAYSGFYTDKNGETRKSYILPGTTFKSYEKARAYTERHKDRTFDIIPV